MILMTFVCMVLVDKLGRRTLHLSGLAGCMVSLISLTVFLTVEKVCVEILLSHAMFSITNKLRTCCVDRI